MGRVLGVLAVACGTIVVGFNPARFDTVLFEVPVGSGHGVHVHDLFGVALVALGTVLLVLSPRSH